MRQINFLTYHHAAVFQPDIDKAISSFDRTHATRLHKNKNSLGYHIAYHWVIWEGGELVHTRADWEIWYINSNRNSNKESIGVCLVGNFDVRPPTEAQLKTLAGLMTDIKKIYPKIKVNWHRDINPHKTCPGKLFPLDELKYLYNNDITMSIFREVWLKEVAPKDRTFTKYNDTRNCNVEDTKFLLDIGLTRDNKKDDNKRLSMFNRIKNLFTK